MYSKKKLQAFTMLFCLLWQSNFLLAQNDSDYVEKVKITANSMIFEFTDAYQNFTVEVSGPDNFYLKKDLKNSQEWTIKSEGFSEAAFLDGLYKVQVTPNLAQSKSEQKILRYLTETDQMAQLKAKKEMLNIPAEIHTYNRSFRIDNSEFVLPRNEAYGLKTPTDNTMPTSNLSTLKLATSSARPTFTSLSLNEPQAIPTAEHLGLNPRPMFIAQVFLDDLIIQGSECVGLDCAGTEAFNFDTQRLKENNLRIHFDDTSNTASFAANDWRIVANETSNGGANYLAFEDATAGRNLFVVEAGAPVNSLYVDDAGRVGLGTNNPVVEIHVKDGDSPAFRIEQDGSSGFTAQTWDIAGNETNFFVRDVTNGSNLPFKIKPGAPENALFVAANGAIGFGTATPEKQLHIRNNAPTMRLDGADASGARYIWDLQVDNTVFSIKDISNNSERRPFVLHPGANDESIVVESDGSVSIGNFGAPSDVRVKKDIRPIENALSIIDQLQPKNYYYRSDEFSRFEGMNKLQYGLIAQEVEPVVGDLINQLSEIKKHNGEKFDLKGVNYIGFIAILIKGMQEQQDEIATLKAQLQDMDELKQQVAALAKMMEANTQSEETANTEKE